MYLFLIKVRMDFYRTQNPSNLYFRRKYSEPALFLETEVFIKSHVNYKYYIGEKVKIFKNFLKVSLNNIIINYIDSKTFSLGGDYIVRYKEFINIIEREI